MERVSTTPRICAPFRLRFFLVDFTVGVMFGPYHLPHLIRYFDGIDLALSKRLLRPVPASEPTLTEELCALLDAGSQRREKTLAFDIDALTAALTANGHPIDVQFRIDVHQHPTWMEAYVSQADFALVLKCKNTALPGLSWYSAYLMQAKRLFPVSSGSYELSSKFGSADAKQHHRLRQLAKILGENALKYCLYCPPTSGYSPHALGSIRVFHAANLSNQIFDFAEGLALHGELARSGGIETGIWISGTANNATDADDLHRRAFDSAHPLTWFLLHHLAETARAPAVPGRQYRSPAPYGSPGWKARESAPSPEIDRVRAIACGDSNAIQSLIDELGLQARKADLDPAARKILPATTMTIEIRVGPPDK